jgi:hypothetical protein
MELTRGKLIAIVMAAAYFSLVVFALSGRATYHTARPQLISNGEELAKAVRSAGRVCPSPTKRVFFQGTRWDELVWNVTCGDDRSYVVTSSETPTRVVACDPNWTPCFVPLNLSSDRRP